jgi:DNA-binding MurR/RpiR family transcriptional regulator
LSLWTKVGGVIKQELFQVDGDRFAVSGSGETKIPGAIVKQLDERLRAAYDKLSPQEQRVAAFIVDHFDDLISYNSAELARLSGVSKATVSRLFKRLGYDRYKDMRDELRTLRQSGMPLTENRDAVQGNTLLARHYKQEMANLTQWVNALDAQQFAAVVSALVSGRRIFIIGLRNSWPVAIHLRQQLLQSRSDVYLLPQPGQTLAEELVDLSAEDCVVAIAFRRRPRIIKPLLANLHERGIPLVVMSETQASGLAPLCRWHLSAPLESVSAFDSYSSAMSLVNLLANAVLHEALSTGRQRIHKIADLYNELDELEQR